MKIVLFSNNDKINDKYLANFVAVYFLMQAANLLVKHYIGNFPAWSIISKAILALFLIRAISIIIRRKLMRFIFIEGLISTAFIFTYIMGTSGRQIDFSSIVFNSLVVYIPYICRESRKS